MSDADETTTPGPSPIRVAAFWTAVAATLVLCVLGLGVFAEVQKIKQSGTTVGTGIGAGLAALEGVAYFGLAALSAVVALLTYPRRRSDDEPTQ